MTNPILIDTHCHLADKRLRPQIEGLLERAQAAGVQKIICASGSLQESSDAASLAQQRQEVYCMAGLHPHEAARAGEDYLQQIEQLALTDKNVAIGEIGLDYHYNYSPPADQRRVFAEQLELAGKLAKKVVIHTREAFAETMAILHESDVDGQDVVFHSCSEPQENIRQAVEAGAMIGFSGILTFKKSHPLRQAAETVPREQILVETDAPYLSPEPVRKMRTNEPANVAHVAACLAEINQIGADAVASITTANAVRFFGLPAIS